MSIDDISKEVIVLEYLKIVGPEGTTTKDIRKNLDGSYLKALARLSEKFGNEVDVVIAPKAWKHTYIINDKGKENLEIWRENNQLLAQKLDEMYTIKFIEKLINDSMS